MTVSYLKRLRIPATRGGPSVLLASGALLLDLVLTAGCPSQCTDDGFAWQQDPSCLAAMSLTQATDSTDGTATDSTDSMTNPTTTESGGGGGTWCVDADMDGFGDPNNCTQVPPGDAPPPGTVDNDDDCADNDGDTFPGAAPNDSADACMKDADGDDWGDSDPPGDGGPGEPVPGTDCDDADAFAFPGAAPNDDPNACMKDADDDDWGDSNPPGGGMGPIKPGTDCDDANPNAWKSCGGCKDEDNDGWLSECDAYPPDHPGPDCDDSDPNTFPGAAPKDDPNACMKDADGDDWGDDDPPGDGGPGEPVPGTDCDDASDSTFPGAAPEDDPNACMKDSDGDGHGDANPPGGKPGVVPGSDCFDANPMLNPANNTLITLPINSGEISEVDAATGAMTPYQSIDASGVIPWIPTSVAISPIDGAIHVALAFKDRLATINYCGGGMPTLLPAAHKKSICGIAFDRTGQLYGIDGQVDQLLIFNADGSLSPDKVKALTYNGQTLNVADCGMAYDCHADRLIVSDNGSGGIYVVNPADGTTERIADLPSEAFGAGLEYDPTTKRALSCDQTSFVSIAVDGSSDFTKLPDLEAPVDDLTFGPRCN